MKRVILVLLTVMLTLSSMAFGSDEFEISAQIRQRFEMDGRDFNGDTGLDTYNLLRTRLGLTFQPADDLSAFIQIQDSRTFGEEENTLTDGSADNLDLHQAYFSVQKIFDLPLDAKIGRMEVIYGPQRFMGAVGWHNIGRSFDGVIFKLKLQHFSVDVFNLKEVEMGETGDNGDKNVFGAYADFDLIEDQTTQAFLIWQQLRPTEQLDRYTAGLYAKGMIGSFYHETEFAFQGGTINDTDVAAYMFALNLGYKFADVNFKPDVAFGVDYLSGDDDLADDSYKVFDTLYATNHKYYGYMDYFLNIPADTYGLGLMDIHGKLSTTLSKTLWLKAAYHFFSANQDYTLIDGSTEKSFGSEIDLTLIHKYNKHLSFTLGASFFMPGEIFEEERGEDTSNWYYLMTVLTI
jgi:hypothetical protein